MPGPLDRLVQEEGDESVRRWLSRLPERDRRLLEMKYWHGASQAEIAEALGLTGARVSQIHSALIKDARRCLAA